MLLAMIEISNKSFPSDMASRRRLFRIQSRTGRRALSLGTIAGMVVGLLVECASAIAATSTTASSQNTNEFVLQILDPRNAAASTTRVFVNILGRTSPDSKVTIGGKPARLFATGIFVRDQVPLELGENHIAVIATARDGRRLERVVTLNCAAEGPVSPEPPERRLEIVADSIEPARNIVLSRGDIWELSFRGTPGQNAEYRFANADWQPMTEVFSKESKTSGLYRAGLVAVPGTESAGEPVRFRLQRNSDSTNGSRITGEPVVEVTSKARVGFWDGATLRLVRVKEDGTPVSFGIHEVRLGGPYLAELPGGTLLRVTGMQGNNYHVRLSSDLDGWVASRDVELAPSGTQMPHLAFTDLSAYGDDAVDYVSIPYPSRVPFSVSPTISLGGRAAVAIDFFGAHHAATWLSHRPTAKTVREVTVQQVAADRLRVCVELHGQQLWGYKWSVTNNSLRLSIRRPPKLAAPPVSPLKGLKIALEPGHGGSNSGARGVSGSQEKDINRLAVAELARQFKAAGATPVIVRENDEDSSLGERVRRAIAANADFFISVHANSAGHERGYLRVSGTSTYYKWPFCRDLSDAIHTRLLDITKLDDFGNVGNFNYYPIRANTWMPSMLVEQAFMSNPEDEAKMLDPAFRREMMRAVLLGTHDWLGRVRHEAISSGGETQRPRAGSPEARRLRKR